jgi:hypothetical protein
MIEKMVKKAKCNTSTSNCRTLLNSCIHLKSAKLDFSAHEAATQKVSANEPIPASWINWDYVPGETPEPRMAVDKDNIPLVLWLPKFLADNGHVSTPWGYIIVDTHFLL